MHTYRYFKKIHKYFQKYEYVGYPLETFYIHYELSIGDYPFHGSFILTLMYLQQLSLLVLKRQMASNGALQMLTWLGLRSEANSCLQQVTHAFADCLAGPWTSIPWWSLLIVYFLGLVTSGICKRRLHRVAVAKLKAFDQKRSGKPMLEAKKKAEMAVSALDFGDGPGAKKFLYEALSLIDS